MSCAVMLNCDIQLWTLLGPSRTEQDDSMEVGKTEWLWVTNSLNYTCMYIGCRRRSLSAVLHARSSLEVQLMITELVKRFDTLKYNILECLEKHKIALERVADALTSLSPDDDEYHKLFLESHVSVLFKAVKHSELFGTMNFHWNYLNCPLLDHLVQKFDLKEVKLEMAAYKSDLQQFREKTPLALFCHTQKIRHLDPPPSFRKVVVEFNWPESNNDVTLEVVEQFRQEYVSHYSLRDCAMMVAEVLPGSFTITWFVPLCIVEKLKTKVP